MKTAADIQADAARLHDAVTEKLRADSRKRFLGKYVPFDPAEAAAGDRIFVVPLERQGGIESIDPENRLVNVVLGNSMRSKFGFEDLLLPAEENRVKKNQGAKKKPHAADPAEESGVPNTIQTSYNTIDLRGMRVDEAMAKMDSDLDRMSRSGIRSAVIIHGHGTGAMKAAVRQQISFSPYIRAFRPGDVGEGGDGVTIAAFR
jgi:DNA mismatch repair protein MutS2